jgi:hypothetical protein
MKTLLSHLYSKIEGSPEDLATESLLYIINNSVKAKEVFISYIYNLINSIEPQPELYFKTQQSGIDLTRPDMVSVNKRQEEVIIIESKFWAGLTENQPIAYLKRLADSNYQGKKILLFICPDKRIVSLWSELQRKCNEEYNFLDDKYSEDYYLNISSDLAITITSWNKIINVVKQELIVNNLDVLLSDINQLNGLCSRMDEEAFLPLKEQDLGVDIPKRIYGYYTLIDKICDKLKYKANVSTAGLKSNGFYGGYRKYMMINDFSVSLEFNLKYWIEKAETPIWIGIKDSEWNYIHELKDKLMNIKSINIEQIFVDDFGFTFIPVFLPLRVSQNIIVDEIINFINKIFEEFASRKL